MLPDMMKAAAVARKILVVGATPLSEVSIGLWSELLHRELRTVGSYSVMNNVTTPYWPWTRNVNRRIFLQVPASGELKV